VTIRKGEPWGEAVESPVELLVLPDDAALRAHVVAARLAGTDPAPVGVRGGNLARTVGGGGAGRFPGIVTRAPIDLLCVEAGGDGSPAVTWAVASVVARRSRHRAVLYAMNAQFLGDFDVAPRSHPNDGKVDILVVDPSMTWRERRAAKHRALTGTHLPHPKLTARQTDVYEASYKGPVTVWVDGVRWCECRTLRITVEPDALTLYA
jgi:hypothetical protein